MGKDNLSPLHSRYELTKSLSSIFSFLYYHCFYRPHLLFAPLRIRSAASDSKMRIHFVPRNLPTSFSEYFPHFIRYTSFWGACPGSFFVATVSANPAKKVAHHPLSLA